MILERDTSAQIGEGLTWASCVAVISGQLGSIGSLATETTGGEILVAFWPKHGLRSDLRVPNFKKFSWGNMPPDPLAYSHLSARNGRTSLK